MVNLTLIKYMDEILRHTPMEFSRYLFNEIDWDAHLVGVMGPRGVGKSTMLLQHLKKLGVENSLYVAADYIYFADHSLVELADTFVMDGGKRLYIDEIHKYKGWSRELKQIHDTHPGLQVFFTGSSVLEIKSGFADLSRRALIYYLAGLSFREYLELFHGIKAPTFTLEEILAQKATIPNIEHPLPLFREYLATGYYPFALNGNLSLRLDQVVSQTVEVDIAQYADLKADTARKLKRLLAIVSQLAPFKPVADSLARTIGVSKNNIPEYLTYLEAAGMISLLRDDTAGLRNLGKVEKAFIDNPTLMTVLSGQTPNVGSLRETFFYNQMRVKHNVTASRISDFRIGDITFEVGGRTKGSKQLEGAERGVVVRDEMETGYGNVVPLWTFGLNY